MKYRKDSFLVIPNKNILRGRSSEMQAIFFWLCEHSNDESECFPSRKIISEESGVGIRTVDKYLKELEDLGIIKKDSRFKENEQISNLYHIIIVEDRGVVSKTTLPSVKNDTPPSVKNSTQNSTQLNSTQLTAETKVSQEKEIDIPSFEEFCTSQGYSAENRYLGEELGEGRVYLKQGHSSAKTEEKVLEEYKSHVYRLEKGRGVSKTNKSPEHQIFSLFTVIEPTPSKWWENKTQKKAARDLFDLYGIEKVKNALSFYCKNKKEEFIPRIFSPHDLLNKFQQLKDFKERIRKGSSNFASEIEL